MLLLEVVTAIGAFGGAAYLVAGGAGMDVALLGRTPFDSWFGPGIALAGLVAVPMSLAASLEWRRASAAAPMSFVAGIVLMGWIIVQVAAIGYQGVLQPASFLVGFAVAVRAGTRVWEHAKGR